jgi:hypothetical protein
MELVLAHHCIGVARHAVAGVRLTYDAASVQVGSEECCELMQFAAWRLGEVASGEPPGEDRPGALCGDEIRVLIAPGGTGKSALLCSCAIHLAAGKPWAGKPATRPLRVLIVSGEEDFGGLERLIPPPCSRAAITPEQIGDRLEYISTADHPIVVAAGDKKNRRSSQGSRLSPDRGSHRGVQARRCSH